MHRKLLLLGLLRRQHMHGYQLLEFLEGPLAVCTDLKKPTAYYLLNQMSADGWIEEQVEQEGNRPPRRVYRLTAAGEAQFQALLRQNLAAYTPARFEGDISLAYLDQLPPAEAHRLLEARRHALAAALQAARAAPAHIGSLQLLIDHQQRHLQAELDWLETVLAALPEAPTPL
jgi:DNA-binding PadR family transcriptional regulator